MATKKIAKKVASKKEATKRKTTRAPKSKLVSVSGEMCFWVNNGPILSNLLDLSQALQHMTDEQFAYHVSNGKNDFVAWVRDALEEKTCAQKLAAVKNRTEAINVVKSFVSLYTK